MNDRHGRPAVLAANDLATIIHAWPTLARRVAPDSGAGGDHRSSGAHSTVPIDAAVVDVMAEVETWVNFLARVLLEEVPPQHGCRGACHGSEEHACAGHLCGDVQPIQPAERCPMRRDPVHAALMPDLLRQVAEHVGHFTEHEDDALALAFCDDAERLAELVKGAAAPTGRRWREIGARCFERGTSDLGERVPCPGVLRVFVDPDRPHVIPDVVCSKDRTHRIDPLEWQRAYRRTGDAQGAADVVGRWRLDTMAHPA